MSELILEPSQIKPEPSPSPKKNPKEPYTFKKIFFKVFVILSLFCISSGLIFLLFVSLKLPSVKTLKSYSPLVGTEVFSRDGVKIGEFFKQRRIYKPIEELPNVIPQAFIAGEDADYYQHRGISPTGILRAFFKNMMAGRVKQGGSTITQQVAKSLLLSSERSIMRKIKEAMLAFKMENYLNKQEIIEIYMNEIYLGDGAYGIEAAAQTYFGKTSSDLDLAEIAMIAGLTRAPSRDNPRKSMKAAKEKQTYILSRMREEGYISKPQEEDALKFEIKLNRFKDLSLKYAPYFVEHVRRYLMETYGETLVLERGLRVYTTVNAKVAQAASFAIENGVREVDRHQGYRGPLKNISEDSWEQTIQTLKEKAPSELRTDESYEALVTKVDDKTKSVEINLGTLQGSIALTDMEWARKPNPDRYWEWQKIKKPSQALKTGDLILVRWKSKNEFSLFQKPDVQAALIALNPYTGEIEAMVGGYDFEESEFNRSIQSKRQPGSSFKPIIFSAAIDKGYTPASIVVDSPIVYDDPALKESWKPKNYAGKFHGNTIFRNCLIQSRNVPTIKIVQDIGLNYVVSYARNMGIESPLQANLALSLGASVVKPIEMVRAYSVFATGGLKPKPIKFIRGILNGDEWLEGSQEAVTAKNIDPQTLLTDPAFIQAAEAGINPELPLPETYAISPQTAAIMTHLLGEVISSGSGSRARGLDRPAAGKTGTTNDNHDAWFIGYTPNLVAGVWVGHDDSGKSLGVKEDGGKIASPLWLNFMKKALEGTPVTTFPNPPGLVSVRIDSKTGGLADESTQKPISELFLSGTEPSLTNSANKEQNSSTEDFFMDE